MIGTASGLHPNLTVADRNQIVLTHGHVPIMPSELLELLAPQPGQVYLDATLGRGGHAAVMIPRLSPGGVVIGLDLDRGNLDYARQRLTPLAEGAGVTLRLAHANFGEAGGVLRDLGIPGVDLLLADLGFASNQIDDNARGLAFSGDGPLDMRLSVENDLTAADLLAHTPERELADLIYRFGEERLSRRIARKIVELRRTQPIQTTKQLAELVRRAYGPAAGRSRIHPATRTFQALRIAVNGELDALDRLLEAMPNLLNPGGKAAIMSFHSLEDRPVKQRMLSLAQEAGWRRLTRKPRMASEQEQAANPRSRSAKLRAIARPKEPTRLSP